MKDSLLFYINQYEAIKELTDEQLGKLFRALFEKQLGNEVVLDNDIKIAFNFINNQLVVDNKKYQEKVERLTANAKKGGAPKGNQNARKQLNNQNNQIESVNVNDNVNVNVNDNVTTAECSSNVYDYFENCIDLLTPRTIEQLQDYQKEMSDDLICHAIDKAVGAKARTPNYVFGILSNWSKKGIKTLLMAKEEEKNYKKPLEVLGKQTEDKWASFISEGDG